MRIINHRDNSSAFKLCTVCLIKIWLTRQLLKECRGWGGGVQRLRRRSAHYIIFFCSLNSIGSTSLPPVGATWAIPSDEDLSYYDSPIYSGILENKKRLGDRCQKAGPARLLPSNAFTAVDFIHFSGVLAIVCHLESCHILLDITNRNMTHR